MTEINIANDFTKYPGLRYESLTPGKSGEKFRDEFLIPNLKGDGSAITVVLDGNLSPYVPSFLEECFGGLARELDLSLEEFKKRVTIVSNAKPALIELIFDYVSEADMY